MDELINSIETLKTSMEETIQSSRKLDILVRIFLTSEEIEEVANLRAKQQENMQRLVDIANYIVHGSSDNLPDIDMVMLEMTASCSIIDNTESSIINIYEAAKRRFMGC